MAFIWSLSHMFDWLRWSTSTGIYYKRLADAAFEAQDEAAKLRQQLQELQQRQEQHRDSTSAGRDDNGKLPSPLDDAGGAPSDAKMMGVDDGDRESYGATAGRVVQLVIERWETEQGKQEAEEQAKRAEEEARHAKDALDEARAKVGRECCPCLFVFFVVPDVDESRQSLVERSKRLK